MPVPLVVVFDAAAGRYTAKNVSVRRSNASEKTPLKNLACSVKSTLNLTLNEEKTAQIFKSKLSFFRLY